MRWLYRLQSQIGLAAPEGTAALVILLALAAGTVARHAQESSAPPAPELLAASDAAFDAADRAVGAGDLIRPVSSTAIVPSAASPPVLEAVASDSVSVEPTDELAPAPPPTRRAASSPVRTGINTASAKDLERLPGIGPALAGRIVAYRQQHGRFSRADQLIEVKGIGPKTFEKMTPWVVVD